MIGAHGILRFFPIQEPDAMIRCIRSTSVHAWPIALDLEDTLWDPDDETRSMELKEWGRDRLLGAYARDPDLFRSGRLGIRINGQGTSSHRLDIDTLSMMPEWRIAFVLVPKSVTPETIDGLRDLLMANGIRFNEIIPIIETVEGVSGFLGMTGKAYGEGVNRILYGHYDYCLDSGVWPFPAQTSNAFLSFVTGIVLHAGKLGLRYVHTPYGNLRDHAGLVSMHRFLDGLNPGGVDMSCLTNDQAKALMTAEGVATQPIVGDAIEDPLGLAERIVVSYESSRKKQHGFAIPRRDRVFISPHEYLAARIALQKGVCRVGKG